MTVPYSTSPFSRPAGDAFQSRFRVPGMQPSTTPVATIAADPVLTGPAVKDIPVTDTDSIKHYMDESLGASILYNAASMITDEAKSSLNTRDNYAEQLAATRALYETVGSYYKAVNVRPQSDPLYVRWWMTWFGKTITPAVIANGGGITEDSAWAKPNGIGVSVMHNPSRSTMYTRIYNAWTALHKDAPDGDHPLYCNVLIRMELDEKGDLLTLCSTGRSGSGLCDFNVGTLYVGCAKDGATTESCEKYTWDTFVWNDPPTPPGSVRGLCRINRALVPMRWFYDAAVELLQQLAARTNDLTTSIPIATASDALVYSTMWNLAVARHFNVVPAELAAVAANLPDMQELAQIQSQQANARVMHDTIGTAASMTGNPYAQAFAAFVEIMMSVLPAATAVEVDAFGRALPFAMTVDIVPTPVTMAPFDPTGRFGRATSRVTGPHAPPVTHTDTSAGKSPVVAALAFGGGALLVFKVLPLLLKK